MTSTVLLLGAAVAASHEQPEHALHTLGVPPQAYLSG